MTADADADLVALGRARVLFALVFLLRTTSLLAPLHPRFLAGARGPLLGWPVGGWHAPVLGLALASPLVMALCVLRTAGAFALLVGVRARVGALVAGVAGYLVLAQDAFAYYHHLHMLFLGALLFGVSDADAAVALRPEPARSPRSSVLLLRVFVASIYAWAAVGKLRADWLDGRALVAFHARGALHGRLADLLLATPARSATVAITVAVVELLLGPLLLLRATRRAAVAAAFALHATFELVGDVDSIGWQMAALLLVFVRPAGHGAQRAASTGHATRESSHISSVNSGPGST